LFLNFPNNIASLSLSSKKTDMATATFASVRGAFDLTSRNYIVTGGAQGIGYALVDAIAQMGGNVVAMDIKDKPGLDFSTLSKQHGVKVQYVQADVTNEEGLKSAFQESMTVLGSLHGCVTCAGLALEKPFGETSWPKARRIHDVNVCFNQAGSLAATRD
jgi:NAD(P)-dependent dehydrogenase (short-subunit alcohol dehydrogenase family)